MRLFCIKSRRDSDLLLKAIFDRISNEDRKQQLHRLFIVFSLFIFIKLMSALKRKLCQATLFTSVCAL